MDYNYIVLKKVGLGWIEEYRSQTEQSAIAWMKMQEKEHGKIYKIMVFR